MYRSIFQRALVKLDFLLNKGRDWFDQRLLQDLIAGGCLEIGQGTYGLRYRTISGATPTAKVVIGSYCSFAPGVEILANVEHPIYFPSTYPFKAKDVVLRAERATSMVDRNSIPVFNADAATRGPIVIGHDVWVGQNAIILSGVHIGTGAVIGAGAVVSRSVPPYAVAVGNPARIARLRFEPTIVEQLLRSYWWDLPGITLRRLGPYLYSKDISSFLLAVDRERSQQQSSDKPSGTGL